MNALDKNESSCWNSDGNSDGDIENSFVIHFNRTVLIEEIRIQFQGGFAAEECKLYSSSAETPSWNEIEDAEIEPENRNSIQTFPLGDTEEKVRVCNSIKVTFHSASDFYGRVIIYKIEVWGRERQ